MTLMSDPCFISRPFLYYTNGLFIKDFQSFIVSSINLYSISICETACLVVNHLIFEILLINLWKLNVSKKKLLEFDVGFAYLYISIQKGIFRIFLGSCYSSKIKKDTIWNIFKYIGLILKYILC